MTDGILWMEGFEGDLDLMGWTTRPDPTNIDAAYARTGGKGLGGTFVADSPLWGETASLNLGFAWRLGEDPVARGTILTIWAPGGRYWANFGYSTQRTFWVRLSGDGVGMPGAEADVYSTYQFDANAWVYIEVNLAAYNSGNIFKVQVNGGPGVAGTTGAEILTAVGPAVGTGAQPFNYYNGVRFNGEAGIVTSFDDVYARTGIPNRGWLGDSQVMLLDLEDDRAVELTRLSGAKNYLMVNETEPDEDTTYNETTGSPQEDIFEVADQGFTGQIHAVQLVARARKTDTSVWTLETTLDLSGTRAYGLTRFIGEAYETLPPDVFCDAPGSTGWTLAQLNAVGVGYVATNVVS